jgi:hypothetical protein
MALAGETQSERNLDERGLRIDNEFHRSLDSLFQNVTARAYTESPLELAAKMSGTQTGAGSDIFQPDVAAKVGIQILYGSPQSIRRDGSTADGTSGGYEFAPSLKREPQRFGKAGTGWGALFVAK